MSKIKLSRDVLYAKIPPFPSNMLIEVTNACNQSCVFCPQRFQKRKTVSINKDFVFKILEEAYMNGTREVGFYMNGEPLLCTVLEEYVYKAKIEGYEYVYLTSNGVLATVERMQKLEKAGLSSFKISINAASRETYKYIHGKDDFEQVKSNIKALYRAKKDGQLHIPLFLSFVRSEDNKREVELLYQQFEELVDDIYVHDANNRAGIMTENVKLSEVDIKPCDMVFNRIHVNSSGFLTACCSDYHGMLVIADLHEMTLKDAWESPEFCELRQQHLLKKIGNNQCFNCIYNVDRKDIRPLNESLYYKGMK